MMISTCVFPRSEDAVKKGCQMTRTALKHTTVLGITMTSLLGAMVCAGQDAPPAAVTNGDQVVAQESAHPTLQRRNPRYKLRIGDSFDLTFPLSPEFNQIGQLGSVNGSVTGVGGVIIQPDGYISL